MKNDIENNVLKIEDVNIPLIATSDKPLTFVYKTILGEKRSFTIPVDQEAHILRRILINNLAPKDAELSRLSNRSNVNAKRFGRQFLKFHFCRQTDGTTKNCLSAYNDGWFGDKSKRDRILEILVPMWSVYLSSGLFAGTAAYLLAWLMKVNVSFMGIIALAFLGIIFAIPCLSKIMAVGKQFFGVACVAIFCIFLACINRGTPMFESGFVFALASIGAIVILGVMAVFFAVMSITSIFDIMRNRYLL